MTGYLHDDYSKVEDSLCGIKSSLYAQGIVELILSGLIISIVSILLWII